VYLALLGEGFNKGLDLAIACRPAGYTAIN